MTTYQPLPPRSQRLDAEDEHELRSLTLPSGRVSPASSVGTRHGTSSVNDGQHHLGHNSSQPVPSQPVQPAASTVHVAQVSNPPSQPYNAPHDDSEEHLVPHIGPPYQFRRYIPRSILNTLGPLLVLAFYLFIVYDYLLRTNINGIRQWHPISPKIIFFTWLLLSIFVLEWAKSGLAGFEATALMKPGLAPANAMQLIWHTDRTWAAPSGWWKASCMVVEFITAKIRHRHRPAVWKGPGKLWWFLAANSFLFFATIPLSGISMDQLDVAKLSEDLVGIVGLNQSTFDNRPSNQLASIINGRWRLGDAATPAGEAIFYAPQGTENVSATFYDDAVQQQYQNSLTNLTQPSPVITIFSGPRVSQRVHGRAWGIMVNISCSAVHPYRDLKLLNVTSMSNWTYDVPNIGQLSSALYNEDSLTALGTEGLLPVDFNSARSSGRVLQYLTASNANIQSSNFPDYENTLTSLPIIGAFEHVMWQAYTHPSQADGIFQALSSHPLVVSFAGPLPGATSNDSYTFLGLAVQCSVNSDVGDADLDAATRTFSNFQRIPAEPSKVSLETIDTLLDYPVTLAIQSLVLGALTTMPLGFMAAPACGYLDPSCNPWIGANLATNGSLVTLPNPEYPGEVTLSYPTITPERMTLALYKLFGDAAAVMMDSNAEVWYGDLRGLEDATDLIPGRIPWQIVLGLLTLWTLMTIVPTLWTFSERRWADTLDGFEMFRLGAEWRNEVQAFESTEFTENDVLLRIPGMIGDMEPKDKIGFVGLSRTPVRVRRRHTFSHLRATGLS